MVTLLRVELHPVDIFALYCAREFSAVVHCGDDLSRISAVKVIGVKKVEARIIFETSEETRLAGRLYVVPTHVGRRWAALSEEILI